MEIKCPVCGKGVEAGPMYRASPLGEKGIFKHESCGGVPVDRETKEISELINAKSIRD